MKKGRFSEEQIIAVLKEHQAGVPVSDLCRKHGISDATLYNWRNRYGGMEVSDALGGGHVSQLFRWRQQLCERVTPPLPTFVPVTVEPPERKVRTRGHCSVPAFDGLDRG